MSTATLQEIEAEIRAAQNRTVNARIAYEKAVRYEERMFVTLELKQREETNR